MMYSGCPLISCLCIRQEYTLSRPKTTHILTFWGGYLKIRTTAFRQEPQFLKGILHNLSTDCKLQDAFCNLLYPGKTRQAVWKLICSDKTWGASPGRNLVFKTVPKEWDIQPQESGHLKNCSNRLGPAQTESEILDHYPAAPKSNI